MKFQKKKLTESIAKWSGNLIFRLFEVGKYPESEVFDHKQNPPTNKFIELKLGISFSTVSKVIHKYLQLNTMFKSKVHMLLPKHIAEGQTNFRKLHEK